MDRLRELSDRPRGRSGPGGPGGRGRRLRRLVARRTILQAIVVLVLAMVAFIAGGIAMQVLAPAGTVVDTSGYEYLRGNLPRLLMALPAVYLVSSFGEEVLYRGS